MIIFTIPKSVYLQKWSCWSVSAKSTKLTVGFTWWHQSH